MIASINVKPCVMSSILGRTCINKWGCYIFLTMLKKLPRLCFLGRFHGFLEGFWLASRITSTQLIFADGCYFFTSGS